ncbi:unnamed protein product [Arctia plantaginis]|uniref:Integrin beta n=1 Tax=Arctia plantaginis TaxID=874455 RepID=A0A8S0ZD88_ARCPL|nr:unnamed protein product [Arctia plantaginis]
MKNIKVFSFFQNVGCNREPEDSWCPYHQQSLFQIRQVGKPGDLITPIYSERSVLVEGTSTIKLTYQSKTRLEIKTEILNSTQSRHFRVQEDDSMIKCTDKSCTTSIEASPKYKFCSESGTNQEFVYVKVTIGNLSQPALIKYHVACACECSTDVGPPNFCSGHGNYSCGACKCEDGWKGERCNQEDCPERGDTIPSCKSSIDDLDCSGNGYCDHCNMCHCNMTLEGSQYFEQDLCSDLCMTVNECSDCTDCIYNSTISQCDIAAFPSYTNVNVLSKNESLLNETDSNNRKMWVKCSMVVKDCSINYRAKREEDGEVYVMVMESCNDNNTGAYTAAPTVSIVLGVLAAVAALVAVAGVMIYKHMNALPPVPLNGVGYTDIDAVDCVGQNPLYKPPTSNFNNPTYGKW